MTYIYISLDGIVWSVTCNSQNTRIRKRDPPSPLCTCTGLRKSTLTPIFFSQNSGVGINTIAIELLSMIFHFARGDFEEESDPKQAYTQNLSLVRLSSVCSHWRQIAIGDGTLWRNISFSPSLPPTIECATEFLARSRGAALIIAIWNEGTSETVAKNSAITGGLLDRIAQGADRITAVVADNPPDIVVQALKSPARNLKYLSIRTRNSGEIPPLFSGTMPNLEILCISNPSGWKIAQFQHLHTLYITASSWRPWRLSALLDCLDNTTALLELYLACFGDFEFEPVGRSVHIPSLLVLRLTYCASALILNHLEIPRSTALSIYNHCLQSDNIFAGFPKISRALRALENVQLLTVILDTEKQVFEVEIMGLGDLHILLGATPRTGRFERKWALRSMAAVARSISISGVKWLTMITNESRMPWKAWLSKFTGLSNLEVRCPDPEELLSTLAIPDNNTGGDICPSLRSLSLERSRRPAVDPSVLRGFLSTRASNGNPISRLNVHDIDWSMVSASEFGAWDELVNRTNLDCRSIFHIYLQQFVD